ncbi:MAG TPA: caspase family protein [Treponemataceae bacterium]|nr:caspase family protein [Treponemataceae bacterium]
MILGFARSWGRGILFTVGFALMATAAFASETEFSGKRYAVLVGVNEYADASIVKLTTPRNDVTEVGKRLERSGWTKVFVLKDDLDYRNQDFPSRTNIENRLNLLADLVKPEDTIFFFFSGHGVSDANGATILPVDASISRLDATGIPVSSILNAFNSRGLRKVVLAIDACRESVSTTKGLSVVGINDGSAATTAALTLYATKSGWYSYEDANGRNGVFTRFLLEGLDGKADGTGGLADGSVTFQELASWLPEATASYALDQGIRQQAIASRGSGDAAALEIPVALISDDDAPRGRTSSREIARQKAIEARQDAIAKKQAASEAKREAAEQKAAEEKPVAKKPAERDKSPFFFPVQISFVTPLQLMPRSVPIYGVALGAIYTQNYVVGGVQAAPIARADSVIGLQAGVLCFADTMGGIQAGGIFTHANALTGAQFGCINTAGSVKGIQVGVVNVADTMKGIQFGVVNIIRESGYMGKFMIGLNARF